MSMVFPEPHLICLSSVVHELFPWNKMCILTFSHPSCLYFCFFHKSFSSFEDLAAFRISWSHVDWCKFYIHLRSLNVCHLGIMVEAMGLKSMLLKSPSMAWPPCWISWNLLIGSNAINGHTTWSEIHGVCNVHHICYAFHLVLRLWICGTIPPFPTHLHGMVIC
jgi:hypothetical protein